MTLLDDLKQILEAKGITKYTDEQLQGFIKEAEALVHFSSYTAHVETDMVKDFEGNTYVTKFYPILQEELFELRIGSRTITPEVIDYDKGIIYLHQEEVGFLRCKYSTGIATSELEGGLLPIIVTLVGNDSGQNISSITEGDVSISYNTNKNGSDNTSLDSLIQKFHEKYDALIRWL